MNKTLTIVILYLITLSNTNLLAQNFKAGESYYDQKEYIEYIAGNLPIILSSSHGGDKEPSEIADRDCENCVYGNDLYTQELVRSLSIEINKLTGCYPHVIINRLARSKLDANRSIEDAADGDSIAETAWHSYNEFLDTAAYFVNQDYGKGIFIDMHGHGHDIQRLELGYLLSKSNLQKSDAELDEESSYNRTSIKNLVNSNLNGYSASELIRGPQSLGSIVNNLNYPSVPSGDIPFPEDSEAFFSGGYNTVQNGSRDMGSIDAIQLECNQDVRFQNEERELFAEQLSIALLEFITVHYFGNQELSQCGIISKLDSEEHLSATLTPNPAVDKLNIQTEILDFNISILDATGQEVDIDYNYNKEIDISKLTSGIYILIINSNKGFRNTLRFIKI